MTKNETVSIPGVVKHIPRFAVSVLRLDERYQGVASLYILEDGNAKLLITGNPSKPYLELTMPAAVFDMLQMETPDGAPEEERQG